MGIKAIGGRYEGSIRSQRPLRFGHWVHMEFLDCGFELVLSDHGMEEISGRMGGLQFYRMEFA